ncbi:hypothetical protein SOVF_108170 [Spinacia oleracea]|nr:hypothetical protein SOVF_108170 [Spinacia oleracea]
MRRNQFTCNRITGTKVELTENREFGDQSPEVLLLGLRHPFFGFS